MEPKKLEFDAKETQKLAFFKLVPEFIRNCMCSCAFSSKDKAFSYAMEDLEEKTNIVKIIRFHRELDIALNFLLTKQQR